MRKRLLLAGAGFLLAILILVLIASVIFSSVELALWYVLWLGDRVLKSLPQVLYWGLLVGLSAVLAITSLVSWRRSGPTRGQPRRSEQGPVRQLAEGIDLAARGSYFHWKLARQLSGLILDVVDRPELANGSDPFMEGGGPDVAFDLVRRRLAAGQLILPPAVQASLEAGPWGEREAAVGWLLRLRRLLFGRHVAAARMLDIETLVQYLEGQMEGHRE